MKKSLSVLAILILMLVPILSACNSESQNEDSRVAIQVKSQAQKSSSGET